MCFRVCKEVISNLAIGFEYYIVIASIPGLNYALMIEVQLLEYLRIRGRSSGLRINSREVQGYLTCCIKSKGKNGFRGPKFIYSN